MNIPPSKLTDKRFYFWRLDTNSPFYIEYKNGTVIEYLGQSKLLTYSELLHDLLQYEKYIMAARFIKFGQIKARSIMGDTIYTFSFMEMYNWLHGERIYD